MQRSERPLDRVRVLVTRPRTPDERLRGVLNQAGATILDFPTIAIESVDDLSALDDALLHISDFDWLLFTSRNAVQIVLDRLTAIGCPPVFPVTLWIGAVGPSTASELRRRGVYVDTVPTRATASDLALRLARRGVEGKRILLPQGTLARPDLQRALHGMGATVEPVVVYRTVPTDNVESPALQELQQGRVDVIALASPSAFDRLHDLVCESAGPCVLAATRLVTIGPSTTAAVRRRQLQPATEAREHTLDGLAQAIIDMYQAEIQT